MSKQLYEVEIKVAGDRDYFLKVDEFTYNEIKGQIFREPDHIVIVDCRDTWYAFARRDIVRIEMKKYIDPEEFRKQWEAERKPLFSERMGIAKDEPTKLNLDRARIMRELTKQTQEPKDFTFLGFPPKSQAPKFVDEEETNV